MGNEVQSIHFKPSLKLVMEPKGPQRGGRSGGRRRRGDRELAGVEELRSVVWELDAVELEVKHTITIIMYIYTVCLVITRYI